MRIAAAAGAGAGAQRQRARSGVCAQWRMRAVNRADAAPAGAGARGGDPRRPRRGEGASPPVWVIRRFDPSRVPGCTARRPGRKTELAQWGPARSGARTPANGACRVLRSAMYSTLKERVENAA